MSKDTRFFHSVFSKYADLSKEQWKLALCNVTQMYTADKIKMFPVSERKRRSEIVASAREFAVKQHAEYEDYSKIIKANRRGGWVC
ncbi:hypothetical protein [Microbulbifer sp. TRSA005]|uniref:hypothetical protein n=1 Tax=unclassified Microbulbifer TaxID=2619833 RepID=UPI004039F37D